MCTMMYTVGKCQNESKHIVFFYDDRLLEVVILFYRVPAYEQVNDGRWSSCVKVVHQLKLNKPRSRSLMLETNEYQSMK